MKTSWYNTRVIKVLTHVSVWMIALSLPYLLDSHHGMPHHRDEGHEKDFLYLNLITNLLWMGPFYLNAYWLTPRLFSKGHYLAFVVILALIFGIILGAHFLVFTYFFGLSHFSPLNATGFLLPTYMLTIAISTTFRFVRDKQEADQQNEERQKENLKTELSFLRSQINPHFIFNILNNLVALEQMKSPELGPTILKLSSLMQYMLYDTDEERVSLNKEIEYLQSYIDLQRQRFGERVPVTVSIEPTSDFYEIEPMLLIPFVENAFKHGVGMIENPAIEISLNLWEGILQFSVSNRFNAASEEIRDKGSGIGLGNVSRRLKLLYGDHQSLQISRDQGWFTVQLELNLH